MIYHGKEKENHRGSHVRYYHCGEWHEGTLLEPVNYQFVVTKENPPAILSTKPYEVAPRDIDVERAKNAVNDGTYTADDLRVLSAYIGKYDRISEVESVEITEADDITQEEADRVIEELKEKYLNR